MYDEDSCVEAYVKPYGGAYDYKEYKAGPESLVYTGNKNERYIGAVDGERFEMGVRLCDGFSFKDHQAVNVRFFVDGKRLKGINHCRTTLDREVSTATYTAKTNEANTEGYKVLGFVFTQVQLGELLITSPKTVS